MSSNSFILILLVVMQYNAKFKRIEQAMGGDRSASRLSLPFVKQWSAALKARTTAGKFTALKCIAAKNSETPQSATRGKPVCLMSGYRMPRNKDFFHDRHQHDHGQPS